MPSVDELLEVAEVLADAEQETETNDYLEINADTRQIIVPESEIVFGVENDEKGERKYFRCKRYVGNGLDLSKMSLRIVYQNASGLEMGQDKYIVTDIKADGDYVTFSWELSRKVTMYKGEIVFIVCAMSTQSDGTVKNEWNTTLCRGRTLQGMEVTGTPEQEKEARDYFDQLVNELLKIATEQKEVLENIAKQVEVYYDSSKRAVVFGGI